MSHLEVLRRIAELSHQPAAEDAKIVAKHAREHAAVWSEELIELPALPQAEVFTILRQLDSRRLVEYSSTRGDDRWCAQLTDLSLTLGYGGVYSLFIEKIMRATGCFVRPTVAGYAAVPQVGYLVTDLGEQALQVVSSDAPERAGDETEPVRALRKYEWVCRVVGQSLTDKKAFQEIRKRDSLAGIGELNTFARNLRRARKATGRQKHPAKGNHHLPCNGGSVIRGKQL